MALDAFRERQAPDVAKRFERERDRHQRQADLMWAGVLTLLFSDHELHLLDDLGLMSQHDHDLLRQAGRWPAAGRTARRPRNVTAMKRKAAT